MEQQEAPLITAKLGWDERAHVSFIMKTKLEHTFEKFANVYPENSRVHSKFHHHHGYQTITSEKDAKPGQDFIRLRLEDQPSLSKIMHTKKELMAQIDWGECFYSAAAESLTTSVLILSTDSWQKTADRSWRICFISTECLLEDHLLHLFVRSCQYLHPHNRTMFSSNSFSSRLPTMKR